MWGCCYFLKPIDWQRLVDAIKAIARYWQINFLPGDKWEVTDARQ
ncbi:MAG: hypothetical protein QHH07_12365 [Sedimentisphaerales bacterium]|jgi:hypothetical protein|nr:hypothetical protein [Sedimentisphaerales bacterium]